jgi:hypothetical protein
MQIRAFGVRWWSAAALIAAGFASSANAQTRDDGGLWLLWMGQGNLASIDPDWKRVRWFLDVQDRNRDEGQSFDTFLFRPALGYELAPRVSAYLGYGLVESEPANRSTIWENRVFQQLNWSVPVEGFTLLSRTRLEQRFLDDESETGWRAREFVKATVPLVAGNEWFASVYDEVFFDLNDTGWGQRTGLRQNRAFVGFGFFLDDAHKHSVEIGYLNQWLDRRDIDRLNHLLSINLFMTF